MTCPSPSLDAAITDRTATGPEPRAGLFVRLARAIAMPFAALAEAMRIRREFELLSQLSERDMRDIGLGDELSARLRVLKAQRSQIEAG